MKQSRNCNSPCFTDLDTAFFSFFFPVIFVDCRVFDSKLIVMIAKVKSKMHPMIKMPALCKAVLAQLLGGSLTVRLQPL